MFKIRLITWNLFTYL